MKANRRGRAIAALVLSLSLLACGDESAEVGLQTVEIGTSSGIILDAPGLFKIDDQAAWNDFWARHKSRDPNPPAPPAVDFARCSVVAVVDRQRSSGGFTMQIDSAIGRDGALRVHATGTEPGHGCVVAALLTEPFHIVRIDKSVLPAVLELSVITIDCSP